jgi:hypothetical protein
MRDELQLNTHVWRAATGATSTMHDVQASLADVCRIVLGDGSAGSCPPPCPDVNTVAIDALGALMAQGAWLSHVRTFVSIRVCRHVRTVQRRHARDGTNAGARQTATRRASIGYIVAHQHAGADTMLRTVVATTSSTHYTRCRR